jgi:hypothetical protein
VRQSRERPGNCDGWEEAFFQLPLHEADKAHFVPPAQLDVLSMMLFNESVMRCEYLQDMSSEIRCVIDVDVHK